MFLYSCGQHTGLLGGGVTQRQENLGNEGDIHQHRQGVRDQDHHQVPLMKIKIKQKRFS